MTTSIHVYMYTIPSRAEEPSLKQTLCQQQQVMNLRSAHALHGAHGIMSLAIVYSLLASTAHIHVHCMCTYKTESLARSVQTFRERFVLVSGTKIDFAKWCHSTGHPVHCEYTMGIIAKNLGKRLIRHEAKPSAILGLKTTSKFNNLCSIWVKMVL